MANNQNRAHWTASSTHLFLQLVLVEKNVGNWGGKSLTKKGYENVADALRRETGLDFNKSKMKNKFDNLRSMFHLWTNMFSGQTGAGYDHATGTITMSEEWWAHKIQQNDMYKKFKKNGLENGDLMYKVFGDSSATGVYQYTPTARQPSIGHQSGHGETSADDVSPTATPRLDADMSSPPRASPIYGEPSRVSGGKRKCSDDGSWTGYMESVRTAFEDGCGSREYLHRHVAVDEEGAKTEKAMNLLYGMSDVPPDSRLFMVGATLISDKAKRDVFCSFRSDRDRLNWLRFHDK